MIARADIVAAARSLIGTPFRHQARLPGVGIDCLNLIGEVGLRVGADGCEQWAADPDLSSYGRTPRPDILLRKCDEYLDRVSLAAVGLGDVLVMAFKVFPQHFAIVSRVNPTYIVHAYPLPGVARVVENGVAVAGATVVRAYRFRGVEA